MNERIILIIRECRRDDLPGLIDLWRRTGITLGLSETIPELVRLLDHNPTTCLVGEVDGRLIGGVMGGFDGRRGIVHHLAVEPEFQGNGFGSALMREIDSRFRNMGVVKYSFWIEKWNTGVIEFYKHTGYELRDLITMSKTLRE